MKQVHILPPLGQAPGKYFKYTNLNYGLLGTNYWKLTGERFDKYQREHILKQLDIKGSYNVGDFDAQDLKSITVTRGFGIICESCKRKRLDLPDWFCIWTGVCSSAS